jgi:cysteine desulfurase
VSALTLTAHKLNGPVGIGALLVRSDVKLEPTMHGGFQQGSLRPGTEPVALAVGFHEALRLWTSEAERRRRTMAALRDRLTEALTAELGDLVVAGADAPRLPHTANVAFTGVNRQALVMALDLAGIACSTGSACASGSSEPSPVLMAMGLPQDAIEGAIRFSLGAFTTADEIDEAAKRIIDGVKDLRRTIKPHKTHVSAS